jgi:hypothetical protein
MKRLFIFLLTLLAAPSFAQTACDSLDIDVKYYAFYDSILEVSVVNHSQAFYSYPGFIIYDTNNDTVAKEEVNLFGIGGESSHALTLYPGMPPGDFFNGTIALYTGFYDSLECSFNKSFKLCPDSCSSVYPYFVNLGGAQIIASVGWQILDASSQPVATGSFVLDAIQQEDEDTICLQPGSYTLHVDAASPGGGQPHIGMTTKLFYIPNPSMTYSWSATSLPFDFFKPCASPTAIGGLHQSAEVIISSYDKQLRITDVNGNSLQGVTIYATDGRKVFEKTTVIADQSIDLTSLPEGVYIVRWIQSGKAGSSKVWLGHR